MTAIVVAPVEAQRDVEIPAPNIRRVLLPVESVAPYVQLRFSAKAKNVILETHKDPTKRGKKHREPKNEAALFADAVYRTEDGKYGIPASAFRNAMIRACSLVGYKMTQAKMSVFVLADDLDAQDGTPLVVIKGKPEQVTHTVRNANGGADVRVRAMWRRWTATVTLEYDADQFSDTDVANLLLRAGRQVGVGEGRPQSKNSAGMGWGTFTIPAAQND